MSDVAQYLRQLGFGLLSGQNIGQAGMLAEQGLLQAKDRKAMEQQKALQQQLLQMQVDQARQQQEEGQRAQQAFQQMPNYQDPRTGMPSLAPTLENAAALAAKPKADPYEVALQEAQYFRSKGLPQYAEKALARAEKLAPKFKEENRVMMVNGKPVLRQFSQTGATRDIQDALPYEKPIEVNRGGTVDFLDPFTMSQRASLERTLSPDTVYQGGITMRGQNMTDARAKEGNTIQQMAARTQIYEVPGQGPVLLDKGTGESRPLMFNGQRVGPAPSSEQRKEMMSINQQRATVQGALQAVRQNPSAFSFRRGAATMAGPIAETVAGRFDKPEEVEARSQVYNIVSKVINERAGAAQSAQELARLRSFLPAEADGPEQIIQKLEAFNLYLDALESGTMGRVQNPSAPQSASDPLGIRR